MGVAPSKFTVDRWQPGQCWLNRYKAEGPFCPKPGRYGNPKAYSLQMRQVRWCLAHKGRTDKRVVSE